MRTFRLGDADLVALAAGRPSRRTLTELRKAQLSRHLLMLHAAGPAPRWYAETTARRDLADPMHTLHTAATLAARRAGTPPPPAPVASPRLLTAEHDGLRLRVRLEDTDPLRDRLGLTPAGPLDDAEVAVWQRHFAAAWRLLVSRHRASAETLADVLSVIVPVVADPGAGGISATSADAFGAVAMSAPADATSLAVGLLHEAQHSVLNAVSVLFDLVHPGGPAGYSPWRDDPRPAFGILHGAYAYLTVTRFWRTEARWAGASAADPGRAEADPGDRSVPADVRTAVGTLPEAAGRLAQFEFARWRSAVVAAADALLAGDRLTAAGRRFTGSLRAEAAGWLAEPVDPLLARLADGANVDHRVRWRLRNLAADPATVAALVRAWRDGVAAPAVPGPVPRPVMRRELEHSDRLTLVHRALRAGEGDQGLRPGGGVRPGDDAYLGGAYGAAAEAYLSELAGSAWRGSAVSAREAGVWGGLALVLPQPALRDRPEVVRALWTALRAENTDAAGPADRPGAAGMRADRPDEVGLRADRPGAADVRDLAAWLG